MAITVFVLLILNLFASLFGFAAYQLVPVVNNYTTNESPLLFQVYWVLMLVLNAINLIFVVILIFLDDRVFTYSRYTKPLQGVHTFTRTSRSIVMGLLISNVVMALFCLVRSSIMVVWWVEYFLSALMCFFTVGVLILVGGHFANL